MLSGTRANIAIKVFGTDLGKMFSLSNQVKETITGIEGLVDVSVEQQVEISQVQIRANREMLAKYGITIEEFTEVVDVAFAGEKVSEVYEGARSFDLVLRYDEESRGSIEAIRNALIDVGSGLDDGANGGMGESATAGIEGSVNGRLGDGVKDGSGGKIPLYYVADIVSTSGPNTINRENVQRKVVVSANVSGRDLRSVVNEIKERVGQNITLPENYRIEYGGQFESEAAASKTLLFTSMIAILIIFLLLYQEFKNVKVAGIILLNLPLALIGGVLAIYFTSGIISIPSIIGFITLFGIATRNGILLVSNYQSLREKGTPLYESVTLGSMDRLNPILMTALTAALALVPLAMAGDEPGNEIQSPMAIVILGGPLSATLLNIFVVPIVYLLMNRRMIEREGMKG